MKKSKLTIATIITFFLMIASNSVNAQLQQDSKYGFKINIPADWSKSSSMDGNDKVYDYYSADQNAAIQLRVFEAGGVVTTEMLAQIFEENMLSAGTQKLSLKNHPMNGIPCKQGVYLMDYSGVEVGLSAYYFSQNNKCYILTAIIPSSMIQQKGAEMKQILKSFMIDGFEAPANIVKEDKKPTGLSGLLGGTTNIQKSPANINSGKAKQFEMQGHYAFDFKLGKVLTFAASTGEGFAMFGGCDGLPELTGKFIITNQNSFKNTTSWNNAALSKAGRHERKRVPFNKVCICELRDGSYAKFMLISEKQDRYDSGCSRTITFQIEYPVSIY
ncbi:MAG: hypothetical protein K8R41_02565 [Bacteroidales bacterium]|nr:hypothetical protein [Bacteroidales bacterium]